MADTPPQPETTYPIQYPLTTIWTAPTDCPDIIRTDGPEKCRPPEYDLWYSNHGYYSPGVCPYGYSVGCSKTSGYVNSNAIDASETAGFCVPYFWDCFGPVPTEVKYATMPQDYSGPGTWEISMVPAFEVRWKSSDLSLLETASMLNGSPSPSRAVSRTSSDGIDATSSPLPSGDSGTRLSTGAIAGIAVGVVLFVFLVIGAVIALFRIRRRGSRGHDGGVPELDSAHIQAFEKDSTAILEKYSNPILEKDTDKGGTSSPISPYTAAEMDASPPKLMASAVVVSHPGTSTAGELPATFQTGQEHSPPQQQAFFSPVELVYYHEQIPPQQQPGPAVIPTPPTTTAETTHNDSPTTSGSAVAGSSAPAGSTVAELLERQAKIQEKRKRLLELHQLEQEEEEIQRQLRESQGR